MDAAATAPGQNASPSRSNGPLLESAATQDGSAPDSASTLNGAPISSAVPPSPTAIRSGTPQTAPVGAISSAGSTAGSDSAQLVDTLHIVATDRNAVDKFDLYDLFSAQDGFQRIAWQNEGYSFVKFQSHEHAISCLRSMKRQLETGANDKLNSIKITVAKMSYVPNYKVPTSDDFAASATLHLSHFPKDSTVLELRRFFSQQSPEGFERLIFHINYCHVLFKDVESAAKCKDAVNRTTNFVLAFAKNVTDMKSRVAANGMGHGLQGDARRLNGHMNDMSFGGARPRPYGNQYAYQFPDGSVNQAYMNLQNRDYEHRTRIQTAQAQMRLAAYGPGAVRGMSMGQGYEGLYPGDYGDRLVYGRPVQPPPSDLFDRSGGASGPRYGQGRYRNGSYESDAGFRDDYGGPRMRPSYSADYMGVMNGNVDWAMAAMQKAASAGGWENNDFMRLQQQQQQQQQPQAQGGRIRSDYDVPQESLRTGYQRGPEVAAGEVFAYDLQRQMVGAYPRPSPAAFYGAPAPVGPAYYGDLEALPGMARIPPGMVVPPSPTSSFDRTIRPPARSGNADDITDAFASILQPVGQDELAQISSTFQNSFSLGNTVQ